MKSLTTIFALACAGMLACGGSDKQARTPGQTTTTSGEQPISTGTSPAGIESITGYGVGESTTGPATTSDTSVPVRDTSTPVPGDSMDLSGHSRSPAPTNAPRKPVPVPGPIPTNPE